MAETIIGTATNFPYPIKLREEEGYLYVTPLYIPTDTRRGLMPVKNYVDLNYLNSAGKLQLTVEISTTNRYHMNGGSHTAKKHPCRGGKFYAPIIYKNGGYSRTNIVEGQEYRFPVIIPDKLKSWIEASRDVFFYARATYRILKYGDTNNGERTGIYSNTIIIER